MVLWCPIRSVLSTFSPHSHVTELMLGQASPSLLPLDDLDHGFLEKLGVDRTSNRPTETVSSDRPERAELDQVETQLFLRSLGVKDIEM
jgi:hypothetical protein